MVEIFIEPSLSIFQYIPQVNFSELSSLSPGRLDEIRRIGTVVIKDVVDDKEARAWQEFLKEFIKANPDVPGVVLRVSST